MAAGDIHEHEAPYLYKHTSSSTDMCKNIKCTDLQCVEFTLAELKPKNQGRPGLGFNTQAVASSASAYCICATVHAHAADAPKWSEICVYKISCSKHTNGNKAWGSLFSYV